MFSRLCSLALTVSIHAALFAAQEAPLPEPPKPAIVSQVEALIQKLQSDEFEVRNRAYADLLTLGPSAVPLLAQQVNHPDPEVSMRVRKALLQLRGRQGEPLNGLVLSAALVGEKPGVGETVTLWLTLTNTTDHDINLYQYFWDLALQDEKDKGTSHPRSVGASTPVDTEAMDFLRLKPGQSVGYLMDADPVESVKNAAQTQAYLEITLPEKVLDFKLDHIYHSFKELTSGPIDMTYALESKPISADAQKVLDKIFYDAEPRKESLTPGTLAEALRHGLRNSDSRRRWKTFEYLLQNPLPELEDDVVNFVGRFGPRVKNEDRLNQLLHVFAAALAPERRPAFILRCARAMIHDWRAVSDLVNRYSISSDAAERDAGARAFLDLYERGDRRPSVMNWVAGVLYSSQNPAVKNVAKAEELAKLAVAGEPGKSAYHVTLALIQGDRAELEKQAAAENTPRGQNGLAWLISTFGPTDPKLAQLALELGEKSLAQTPENENVLDTVAVCYAATGNYEKALELEQQALAKLDATSRQRKEFAQRVARFTALAKGDAQDRPSAVLDSPPLKSTAARDALLARVNQEAEPLVRTELLRLLKLNFPAVAVGIPESGAPPAVANPAASSPTPTPDPQPPSAKRPRLDNDIEEKNPDVPLTRDQLRPYAHFPGQKSLSERIASAKREVNALTRGLPVVKDDETRRAHFEAEIARYTEQQKNLEAEYNRLLKTWLDEHAGMTLEQFQNETRGKE